MKNLKENIQKNNMKKLVLSAVLGMFCYCTNNAMKKQIEINYVLKTMLAGQVEINEAREKIKDYEKKIYCQISEEGKVTKKKVLEFISERIASKEEAEDELKNDIEILGQYYHLEDVKEEDECTKKNLTEIFWEKVETLQEKDKEEIDPDGVQKIKEYFQTIIKMEKAISKVFKDYYDAKKTEKGEVENVEDVVIKEIMNDCCGEGKGDDIQTKFLDNLRNLCTKKSMNNSDSITGKIKRRITLSNSTGEYEKAFISFLKQKIGEDKKEEKKEDSQKDGKPKVEKEVCCPCCDCLEKNKNPEEDPQDSQHEI